MFKRLKMMSRYLSVGGKQCVCVFACIKVLLRGTCVFLLAPPISLGGQVGTVGVRVLKGRLSNTAVAHNNDGQE